MAKRKPKMITLTEENFRYLAPKIKKFLERDIVMWHSFDCGSKRHIPTHVFIHDTQYPRDVFKTLTFERYSDPKITIVTPESEPVFSRYFIRMNLQEGYGGVIDIGDEVCFTGNRMHLKQRALPSTHQYCYDVYQPWDPNGGFKNLWPTPPDPTYNMYDEEDYL